MVCGKMGESEFEKWGDGGDWGVGGRVAETG